MVDSEREEEGTVETVSVVEVVVMVVDVAKREQVKIDTQIHHLRKWD